MRTEKHDDYYSPVTESLSDFATDALSFSSKSSPGEKRDVFWLRWLKYLSLIVVPAAVFGLGFLFEDYFLESNGQTYRQRQYATSRVQHDSVGSMKLRFGIGAGLGGGLGLVYVIRCRLRKVDP